MNPGRHAQGALRALYGEITLFPNENGCLEEETKKGHLSVALSKMALVAGAGFGRCRTGSRIPLID